MIRHVRCGVWERRGGSAYTCCSAGASEGAVKL